MHLALAPGQPQEITRHRRIAGALLGAILGLGFGLTSQYVNRLALPGVPLYQPFFGPAGNAALAVAGFAVLGLLATWPESAPLGIAFSSLAGALYLVTNNIAASAAVTRSAPLQAIGAAFLFVPLAALAVPAAWIGRWAVGEALELRRDRRPVLRQALLPVMLLLASAGSGALALEGEAGRAELGAMDAMVRAGLAAPDRARLPLPLAAAEVGDFSSQARGPYTLQWVRQDLNRFRIPRPPHNFDGHAVVIARFASGWHLVCLYPAAGDEPICRGFAALPKE